VLLIIAFDLLKNDKIEIFIKNIYLAVEIEQKVFHG